MTSDAKTVLAYLEELSAERKSAVTALRAEVLKNLPAGFKENMGYGMIGYAVPHDVYPPGYHCDPSLPLPFAGIASQKNFIAFYHMGIYADPKLLKWFVDAWQKFTPGKLDMGKSCLRFKKPEQIPYKLIGELMSKLSATDWIQIYENNFKDSRKKVKEKPGKITG